MKLIYFNSISHLIDYDIESQSMIWTKGTVVLRTDATIFQRIIQKAFDVFLCYTYLLKSLIQIPIKKKFQKKYM